MSFMIKELSKETTARSRLRNNFKKNRTEENKIQNKETNVCLFQEVLKEILRNRRWRKVIDNKHFSKTIRDRISRDKINLIGEEEIVKSESETFESGNFE